MSKIFDKFIPSELINGEEYAREDLGKIFDSPEIINHFGGILEIKNCTVLLMTLDKSVLAELPGFVASSFTSNVLTSLILSVDVSGVFSFI